MFLNDAQVAIWVAFGAVPSWLWSNAQLAFMRGLFGGNEGVRRYLGGFVRLESESLKPRFLEFYVRQPESPGLRQLQRRLQLTAALAILVAVIGWPLAGILGEHVTISESAARSLQVAVFASAILWAVHQYRLSQADRWAPTCYVFLAVVGGIGGIAMSVLAPSST
jgi:hypothetical protein